MRLELEEGWVELKDLRHINYGEAKAMRNLSANGDGDGAEKAILYCVSSWELKDSRGEAATIVDLETLYRLSPAVVGKISETIGEELTPALPLAPKKE
jgi:hypothetical protein